MLLDAVTKDPGNARYVFYLAQSYKDAGDPATALYWYRRRASMNGWVEENWFAQFMVARLLEMTERDGVATAYLDAYQYRSSRAEPLFYLARHHRLKHEYALAYMYASQGTRTPMTSDRLFVDLSIYDWRLLEELALSAYYVGEKLLGGRTMRNLVQAGKAPAADLERFKTNMRWYE